MRRALLFTSFVIGASAGCFDPQFQQGVPCTEDRECPEGQVCNADNLCFDEVDIDECTPTAFIACDETVAQFCDARGSAVESTDCGMPGCNDAAGRCNECVPDTVSCSGDALETCDADGLLASSESCAVGCVDGTAELAAHCAYLSPKYLPDVCDALAEEESLVVNSSGSIDTDLDANCNGGIVAQTDGPEICVFRYGSFRLDAGAELQFIGSRAVAIVTDGSLEIAGTLDLSADGATNGPGGGTISSGTAPNDETGAGGAGFRQPGAAGGSTVAGGGGSGGDVLDPLPLDSLIGGPRASNRFIIPTLFTGGGGGGAATLISCRGLVAVIDGAVVDAGGGGGLGGGQVPAGGGGDIQIGGRGGGAGGQVVVQGLVDVQISGQLFANGGGGGGGGADTTAGGAGSDGPRMNATADGGNAAGAGGDGGRGGANVFPAVGIGHGAGETSAGGGGGSAGFFRIVVPADVTPTLDPSATSPPLSPTEIAPTR